MNAPIAASSSAYYDPHSKCIALENTNSSSSSSDGRGSLTGVIVDTSPADIPFLRPGRMLAGEIIEIIDPSSEEKVGDIDENEGFYYRDDNNRDDDGRDAPAGGSAGGILTHSFVGEMQRYAAAAVPLRALDGDSSAREEGAVRTERTKERLLQKQRQLQTLHARQTQNLLAKQQKDWLWFHSYKNSLSERRLLELEGMHQREAMDLQMRQQREQGELLDLMFDIMMTERRPVVGNNAEGVERGSQTDEEERPPPMMPMRPSSFALEASPGSGYEVATSGRYEASTTNNRYEASSSAVPLGATPSRTSPAMMNYEATTTRNSRGNSPMTTMTGGLEATTTTTRYEAAPAPVRRNSPAPPLPPYTATSRASPIPVPTPSPVESAPASARTSRNSTPTRSPGIPSRSPPRSPVPAATTNGATEASKGSSPSLPDRISTDRHKANEIKAVMRNRGLSREERQKALAEIKERYASSNNNINGNTNTNGSGRDVVSPAIIAATTSTNATTATEKSIPEQRRLELQQVMKDRTLGREEKQTKMAEIKSKYAAMSDRKNNRQEAQEKIDAMKARVATNKNRKREEEPKHASVSDRQNNRQEAQEKIDAMKARVAANKNKKREEEPKHASVSDRQNNRQEAQEKIDAMKARVAANKKREEELVRQLEMVERIKKEKLLEQQRKQKQLEEEREEDEYASPEETESEEEEDDDQYGDELNMAPLSMKPMRRGLLSTIPSESPMQPGTSESGSSQTSYELNPDSNHLTDSNHTGHMSEEPGGTDEGEETEEGETSQDDDSDPEEVAAPPNGKKESASKKWNRGAVKAVTANIVAKSMTKGADNSGIDTSDRDAATTDEEPSAAANNKTKEKKKRVTNRWNKAGVKAATASAIAKTSTSNSDSMRSSATSAADMVFDGPNRSGVGLGETKRRASISMSEPTASNETSASDLPLKDPLEDMPTDRTPIKKLVKRLNEDDAGLTVLKLDGRKKIKEDDWGSLFESLEENATLTHLSLSRCDISDEMAVNLVLALVENETLEVIRLSNNKGLTDDTAKGFIKVLLQSNKTLKKLELQRTKVTKKSIQNLSEILEERCEKKQSSKLQMEREAKIKALLSFSAGDKVAKELSASVMKDDDDDDDDNDYSPLDQSRRSEQMSVASGTSSRKTGSKASNRKKVTRRGRQVGAEGAGTTKTTTRSRSRSTTRSGQPAAATKTPRRAGGRGRPGGRVSSRASMRNPSMRASVTAQQMAQLGGNLTNVGGDTSKLKEQRKIRGECEVCGQKCYTKTMFKTTPITLPNLVYEGRCLKCDPM